MALENSGGDEVIDEERYDYFGDMPNPNPEDRSPQDISGEFIALFCFCLSRKCQETYPIRGPHRQQAVNSWQLLSP